MGTLINKTLAKVSMDVARIMIRTRCLALINEAFSVSINGVPFRINVLEESPSLPKLMLGRRLVFDETGSEDSTIVYSSDKDMEGESKSVRRQRLPWISLMRTRLMVVMRRLGLRLLRTTGEKFKS